MFHTLYPQNCQEPILTAFSSFTTDLTDRTDKCPMGKRIDQKVCSFPQAYALAARCVCSAMKASFPV